MNRSKCGPTQKRELYSLSRRVSPNRTSRVGARTLMEISAERYSCHVGGPRPVGPAYPLDPAPRYYIHPCIYRKAYG